MAGQTPIKDMNEAVQDLLDLATEEDGLDALAYLLGCLEYEGERKTAIARVVGPAARSTAKFLREREARLAAWRSVLVERGLHDMEG